MFRPCRVQQKQEGTAICVFVTKHKAIIEVITDRYMHTYIYYLNLCFDRSLTAKIHALEIETGMNTLSMNNFFKFPNFLKPYWVEYDKKQSQASSRGLPQFVWNVSDQTTKWILKLVSCREYYFPEWNSNKRIYGTLKYHPPCQ